MSAWTFSFATTATAIYSLGHGLHIVNVVAGSTQPCSLREMVT